MLPRRSWRRTLQPGPRLLPFAMLGLEQASDLAALAQHPLLGQLSLEPIQGPVAGRRHLPLRRLGWQRARLGDHATVRLLGVGPRASRARGVVQPVQPCRVEALDPTPHTLLTLLQLRGDCRGGHAGRRQLDEARASRQAHRRRLGMDYPLQFRPFLVGQGPQMQRHGAHLLTVPHGPARSEPRLAERRTKGTHVAPGLAYDLYCVRRTLSLPHR